MFGLCVACRLRKAFSVLQVISSQICIEFVLNPKPKETKSSLKINKDYFSWLDLIYLIYFFYYYYYSINCWFLLQRNMISIIMKLLNSYHHNYITFEFFIEFNSGDLHNHFVVDGISGSRCQCWEAYNNNRDWENDNNFNYN